MPIQLTPKHNEAAGNLINLFIKYAKAGEIGEDAGYLAAFLGLIAGREVAKEPTQNNVAELVEFLMWVGEVLKFSPVIMGGETLSAEASDEILRLIAKEAAEINAAFFDDYFPPNERANIALLAVANAVEYFGNDKEPFTFTTASSLALGGLVYGSNISV
ncbi:hypothetical protein [Pseudaquidulcibacter saccharophilus]|uniref:hypothetical protein n=1 Tax=Pseudaquidulcibacter saccharophilus TaxID=2831900 RepID=UPI001EFF0836|nr:hypothetical protein [Pseudaquidulcibacter saccharophilus]